MRRGPRASTRLPRRRWPAASFAAGATALTVRGCRVAVVGHGPDDARAGAEIAASSPAVDLVGALDMKAMVGVLARARLARDDGSLAAIAGERAASEYGLHVVAPAIQDEPHNRTRFAVVTEPSRQALPKASGRESSKLSTTLPPNSSTSSVSLPGGSTSSSPTRPCRMILQALIHLA